MPPAPPNHQTLELRVTGRASGVAVVPWGDALVQQVPDDQAVHGQQFGYSKGEEVGRCDRAAPVPDLMQGSLQHPVGSGRPAPLSRQALARRSRGGRALSSRGSALGMASVVLVVLSILLSIGCAREFANTDDPAGEGVDADEPGEYTGEAASLELPAEVDPGQTLTFYDNGVYREAALSEIANLVGEAAADPRAMLGPEWYRSPSYVARYFTLNLLGIADWRQDAWSQCASGPGNTIQDGQGVNLGVYLGPLGPDDENETAAVTLKTAEETAYLITLARAWPGGPWLVVGIDPTEYSEAP